MCNQDTCVYFHWPPSVVIGNSKYYTVSIMYCNNNNNKSTLLKWCVMISNEKFHLNYKSFYKIYGYKLWNFISENSVFFPHTPVLIRKICRLWCFGEWYFIPLRLDYLDFLRFTIRYSLLKGRTYADYPLWHNVDFHDDITLISCSWCWRFQADTVHTVQNCWFENN